MAKIVSKKTKQRMENVKNGNIKIMPKVYRNMESKFNTHYNIQTECDGCYFLGKEPLVAIYPKDGDVYPYKEAENREFNVFETAMGITSYLKDMLVDFNSREAAEDMLFQMTSQIQLYLDKKMGKTTFEKMHDYQTTKLANIFSKVKPKDYEDRYKEWMEKYENTGESTPVAVDDVVEYAACKQAYVDKVAQLNKNIKQLENDKKFLNIALTNMQGKLTNIQEKLDKEEKSHSEQVKGLMKEIKSLEATIKRMEKNNVSRFIDEVN